MLQEKYNRRIFDEGTKEAIQMYSHLRSNVLSPVNVTKEDNVLIINPDSVSMVEWLEFKAGSVTVGMTGEYKTEHTETIEQLPADVKKEDISLVKDAFTLIVNIGSLTETPSTLKSVLAPEGRLIYVLAEKARLSEFTKKLLNEAGFDNIKSYRLHPDYFYTTEIYSEDYMGGGAGDYLLIARS